MNILERLWMYLTRPEIESIKYIPAMPYEPFASQYDMNNWMELYKRQRLQKLRLAHKPNRKQNRNA